MSGKNVHVTHRGDQWAVVTEGTSRADSLHQTQGQAIDRAREIARQRQAELIIHGRDNRIRERDSYGNDPFPPRG